MAARAESGVAPTLTDGVVVLDGHTLDDIVVHLAGEDEEQARRFGWYPRRSTADTVRAAILRWQHEWQTGGATRAFATRDAGSGKLVGGCEIRLLGDGVAYMSYWTFPRHRRRGYASRAVRLAFDYAVAQLGIRRAELHVEPDNVASRGVARRAGFTEAGVTRQPLHEEAKDTVDLIVYARSPSNSGDHSL